MLQEPSIEINYHYSQRKKILVSPRNSQKLCRKRIKNCRIALQTKLEHSKPMTILTNRVLIFLRAINKVTTANILTANMRATWTGRNLATKNSTSIRFWIALKKTWRSISNITSISVWTHYLILWTENNKQQLQSPVTKEPYITHIVTPAQVAEKHLLEMDGLP